MASECVLEFRYSATTSADAHGLRRMSELMEALPNPVRLAIHQEGARHSGSLRVRAAGGIALTECRFEASGSNTFFVTERARPYISRNHSFEYHVSIVLGGDNRLDACGRTHGVCAGDFFVVDTDTPFAYHMENRGHVCCLALPESWDRVGETRLAHTFGNVYPGRERARGALIRYAKHLLANPDVLSLPDASKKLYDVIALALNPRAKGEHRLGLLALIRNHIEAHCPDPELDPAKVAAEFGISVRYLHMLFAAGDSSFTEYLIEKRLAYAHRMLTSPNCRHQKIYAIAYASGFRNLNHFGKRFQVCYGMTPREIRERS